MDIPGKLTGPDLRYQWTIGKSERDGERQRKAESQKLYDYYIGDLDEIKQSIIHTMRKQFKDRTLAKMQFPTYNITKKIIDRIALAYLRPAERYVLGNDQANKNLQELLNGSNINPVSKQWNRLSLLLDTIIVAPVWRNDHVEFDIFPPHLITVQPNTENYLDIDAVMYRFDTNSDDGVRGIHWTATTKTLLDEENKVVYQERNPYGILQFVPCRLRETEDFWGEGDAQLVEMNEQINILLANASYNSTMQSHGQPVAINLGIKNNEIQTGPDIIMQAENVREGMVKPDFRYEQPRPATADCMKQIEDMIKTTAMLHGLPSESVSLSVVAQAGVAKLMDNWELMEKRIDQIEWLRIFEKKLFKAASAVWNFHTTGKIIPVDSNFGIDFEEPEVPQDPVAEMDTKFKKAVMGLYSPVDDMIDEDEGIDEAKALELIKRNLEINKELGFITPQVIASAVPNQEMPKEMDTNMKGIVDATG